jgi:hypothetical protein
VEELYNWKLIWMVPFIMAVVFLIGFLLLFRENLKKETI